MKRTHGSGGTGRHEGYRPHGGRHGYTRCFVMEDPLGFHSRPAALFVQTAQQFDADVLVTNERGAAVNGKSIMGLLTLAIQCGEKMAVTVQGPDAAAALEALGRLLADAFGERQPAAAMMANEEPALFADTARQEDAGAYAHAER